MLSLLSKLFAPVRALFTPPPIPSTDDLMDETEREIEEGAALVESNRRAEWVRRARSMVGSGRYCLGAGPGAKGNPRTPFGPCAKPDEHTHEHAGPVFSDCSGFTSWVTGVPRYDVDAKVWRNTDHLQADAEGKVKGDIGDGVPWKDALPGDLVVFGAGKRIGHVGIVVETDASGPTRVVHCQASKTPAVIETSEPGLFKRKGAVILRLR